MEGGRQPFGFTIIEVMIVLAISGFIFLSAVLLINGKQSSTEFFVSTNDFKTEMQHVVSDIVDGYYPNTTNYSCSAPTPGTVPTISSSASKQGTDYGCVFLGKVVQFNNPNLNIYVVAGNQFKSDGSAAESLTSANPILVAPSIENYAMEYGLSLACGSNSIQYYNQPTTQSPCMIGGVPGKGHTIESIAFVTSPTSPNTSNGIQTGPLQINMVPIDASSVSGIDRAFKNASSLVNNPAGGVKICLKGSAPNYSALITIGSVSRQPTVNMAIKNDITCQ